MQQHLSWKSSVKQEQADHFQQAKKALLIKFRDTGLLVDQKDQAALEDLIQEM